MIRIARFLKDESGATAIEYGLIAALVGVAIAATMTTVGTNIVARLNDVNTSLTNAAP